MKKFISIIALFTMLGIAQQANAQFNKKTVGFRSGDYTGFSGRLMFEEGMALEGIIGWRNKGTVLTVRATKYKPLDYYWSEGFSWYYGVGGHLGSAKIDVNNRPFSFYDWNESQMETAFVSGINGALGVEYKFNQFPFYLGFEVTPFLELRQFSKVHLNLHNYSFTLRYMLFDHR